MLKGGIIGLGNVAINGHLPSYLHDPILQKEVRIVGGVDLKSDNRDKFKKLFNDINLYSDADELFKNESLDFIDICTPPNTHKTLIQKAIKYNCHILCEKPLATNLKEALDTQNLLLSSSLVFLPCHQYHFSTQWQAIRKIIQEQKIGKIHFAQAQVFRVRANEGNVHWEPEWRTKKEKSGGGILIDHGAHLMYLFISLFGKPIKISANVKKLLHKSYEVEDTACVILEFSECMLEFVLTWTGHSRRITYRFLGDAGELFVGDDHLSIKYSNGHEEKDIFETGLSRDSSHSSWFTPLIKLFIHRIKNKDYRKDGLEEAILALRCILLAYQSSVEEKTLHLS